LCFIIYSVSERVDVGFVIGNAVENKPSLSTFNLLSAVNNIVKRLDVGTKAILPGVITYGKTADVVIPLNSVFSKTDLVRRISNIKLPAKGNSLKDALRKVSSDLFNPRNGARMDASKTIYLFIGNEAKSLESLDIKRELQALRAKSVKVVTIFYGDQDNSDDVKDVMAPSDVWFFPEDLDELICNVQPMVVSALSGIFVQSTIHSLFLNIIIKLNHGLK